MRVFAIIFTIIANLTDLFKEKTKGKKWHRWPEADAWLSPEGQFESPCGASGPECLSRPHGTETRLRQEFAGGAAGGTQMALASWKPETHSATPPGGQPPPRGSQRRFLWSTFLQRHSPLRRREALRAQFWWNSNFMLGKYVLPKSIPVPEFSLAIL